MVGGRQRSKLSKGGKQHTGKGSCSKYTGRLGELPVTSYMSVDQAHDIAPLKCTVWLVAHTESQHGLSLQGLDNSRFPMPSRDLC
jgi:hypothetical protein